MTPAAQLAVLQCLAKGHPEALGGGGLLAGGVVLGTTRLVIWLVLLRGAELHQGRVLLAGLLGGLIQALQSTVRGQAELHHHAGQLETPHFT